METDAIQQSLKVDVDRNSGFCFGVVYAIQMAEDELDAGNTLYCLGDIVHNNVEVERLQAKGLKTIQHEDLHSLPAGSKVLIRAHGEPPETYKTALENELELIDASCPVVLKLQNRIKNAYDKSYDEDGQVVIFGLPGHAEIKGLNGQIDESAIIVTNEEDIEKIDFTKPINLFSQTTKSTEKFYKIKQMIEERASSEVRDKISANDTICRQVSNREPQLREFASQYDVIVFVSGRKSSNGKVLHGVCQSVNERSYFVSSKDEIDWQWFDNAESVGVCGATSTPMWLMEEVADHIRQQA
jgi:4-hydroxy-3-methylbut-2-enyl diphosphate reductase